MAFSPETYALLAGKINGGGGSGGGSSGVLIVNMVLDESAEPPTATSDKTPEEIKAAVDSGKMVFANLYNEADSLLDSQIPLKGIFSEEGAVYAVSFSKTYAVIDDRILGTAEIFWEEALSEETWSVVYSELTIPP